MKIINIGYNHRHDADFSISRPNGSGDYLLLLLKTPALFTIHDQECVASKNSFILFHEGTPQYYHALGSEFLNDWFHFSLSSEDEAFLSSLHIPFDQLIRIGDMSQLSMLVKNMSYENYSNTPNKQKTLELYFQLFFLKLSEKLSVDQDTLISTHYEKLSIIRSKIYNMPQNDWKIEHLAHELAMSRSHFEHMYKNTFNVSVMNDVINSRIDYSIYLLTTTDMSVKQIAELCGYKSDIHFMRQFKSRLQLTPTQYRVTHLT